MVRKSKRSVGVLMAADKKYCPKCFRGLNLMWSYCPMCGHKVKSGSVASATKVK
jgi:predicted amidophosphoribosyltransferase